MSKLGLKALELIEALCRRYKIPQPDRPEYYTPRESFEDELAKIEQDKQKRNEATSQMIADMTNIESKRQEGASQSN